MSDLRLLYSLHLHADGGVRFLFFIKKRSYLEATVVLQAPYTSQDCCSARPGCNFSCLVACGFEGDLRLLAYSKGRKGLTILRIVLASEIFISHLSVTNLSKQTKEKDKNKNRALMIYSRTHLKCQIC